MTNNTIKPGLKNFQAEWTDTMTSYAVMKGLKPLKSNFDKEVSWTLTDSIWLNEDAEVFRLTLMKGFVPLPVHPMGNYEGFYAHTSEGVKGVRLHRAVYSAMTERPLRKNMAVHHVNGIKRGLGNRFENLQLVGKGQNVSLFFSGADGENAKRATSQEYLFNVNSSEPEWRYLEKYNLSVNQFGDVRTNKGQTVRPTANANYPLNLIVGYRKNGQHSSVSVTRLVADAFLVTPNKPFKVLIKDRMKPLSEVFSATNLFTV